MKRRPDRDIEIFSLSAIDLFAAAMGAFALLTIVLIPYYQKEVRERTPENAIADLLRAAEVSSVETTVKKKALEQKRSASAKNVSDIKSQADKLLAELRAAEAALLEKRAAAARAVIVPEPIEEKPAPATTPKPAIVSFRFLGMKTVKDDIIVALDMNKCMGGHEATIDKAMSRILNSLQDNHAVKVIGFQQTDAGPQIKNWPSRGGLQRVNTANRAAAMALARRITQMNAGRKEIHTVVVGNYFDYDGTVEFMERLSTSNNGEFMALASPTQGVCD